MNVNRKMVSAALATTAAALFATSAVVVSTANAADDVKVKCYGANACKGHSEALLMGAAAQKYGLFLCVQDLTCPGRSFLHSASLAARMPSVAAKRSS